MVSDWIPHGTIPRILPILSGYQQSLSTKNQCNPTRSGKSVGLNLPYDKSYLTEHRDGSLSEPHPTPTAVAGLTKPANGLVLHAAQQVVRGELNVCLVSWQHGVCAAPSKPRQLQRAVYPIIVLTTHAMAQTVCPTEWQHTQYIIVNGTTFVFSGAIDTRIPRILHLSQSGNRRAFDCQTLENSAQRTMSDVTLNGKRGVSVHNVEIPQSSYWGRHMNSGTCFRIHYKSWIIRF